MSIDKTLIPGHADWNIRFATNQLVLCYTDKSRYADEVNADNWTDILTKKGWSGAIRIPTWIPADTAA
jgi:molybdate/tungstate transport system substrate-binding protein